MKRTSLTLIFGFLAFFMMIAHSNADEKQLIGARYPAVSSDGKQISFSYMGDLWLVSSQGGKATRLTDHVAYDREPIWSPDGQWLAYNSDESGLWEVYVVEFLKSGLGKRQLSTEGGFGPIWAPDGREIYYTRAGRMFSVPIITDPVFKVGEKKVLFDMQYRVQWAGHRNYDIHPEGNKFVTTKSGEQEPLRLFVVLNWIEELKLNLSQR